MSQRILVAVVAIAALVLVAALTGAPSPDESVATIARATTTPTTTTTTPSTTTTSTTTPSTTTIDATGGSETSTVEPPMDPLTGQPPPSDMAAGPDSPLVLTTASADVAHHDRTRGSGPVRLTIDRLGVDAPIVPVGADARSGEMGVVDNVTDVGWFEPGPGPGEPGSAVLAAHVDLAGQGAGVFFFLEKLSEGDTVGVTHEDGSVGSFRVVSVDTTRKDELDLDRVFARDGDPVLTLITCGGGFNPSLRKYDSNVVVVAEPIGESR